MVCGSSLSLENKEDLERTQIYFANLVLREQYRDNEAALIVPNLETLEKNPEYLLIRFAKSNINTDKLNELFHRGKTEQSMNLRNTDFYRNAKANTERFSNSSMLATERLFHKEHTRYQ